MPAPHLAPVSLTVDQPTIDRYARLTQDPNPIHLDAAFAAGTEMGGIIAHGTLSMNLLWLALGRSFGPARLAGATLDIRFVRPVRVGDVVTTEGVPAEAAGSWRVRVVNQRGEPVIEGHARLPED